MLTNCAGSDLQFDVKAYPAGFTGAMANSVDAQGNITGTIYLVHRLGPAMREDGGRYHDLGKVLYYDGSDYSKYRAYRPLCRAWLWLHGF